MYCRNCGTEFEGSFCPKCGTPAERSGENVTGSTEIAKGEWQSSEKKETVLPFRTCRMVMNIVSIVMFFFIVLQSCSAGVVNIVQGNSEASGSAGVVLSFCWLIAGIVGLAGRKNKAAVGVSSAFYLFGGIIGICNIGIFADLALWSGLSFAFGTIGILAICFKNNETFQKTGASTLLELIVIVAFVAIGMMIADSGENSVEEASEEVENQEQVESEEPVETSDDSVSEEKIQETKVLGKPEYTVTIDEFQAEVEKNAAAASEKYLGKTIMVTGEISYIGGSGDNYYLSLSTSEDDWSFSTLDCYADKENISKQKEGTYVAVTGIVEEDLWNPFALENCTFKTTKRALSMKKINATVKKKYKDIIDEMSCNYDWCEYAYYDINEDGIQDLIIGYGSCEADYMNDVYTANTKCEVSSAGSFDSSCLFYEAEKGKGIYAVHGHMGYETVTRITLKKGKLKTKQLWSKEVPDDNYYSNSNEISLTQVNNEVTINQADNGTEDVYILPNSDSCYLTDADVSWMSPETLRVARNEIYARHGRIFDSADLSEYFNSQSWYTGLYTADEFEESWLNKYEKANVRLINSYE